jgi:hypothetical protein
MKRTALGRKSWIWRLADATLVGPGAGRKGEAAPLGPTLQQLAQLREASRQTGN